MGLILLVLEVFKLKLHVVFTEFYRNLRKNPLEIRKIPFSLEIQKFGFWNFMKKTNYWNLPGPTGNSVNPEITTQRVCIENTKVRLRVTTSTVSNS